jgi:hypothetical protein
MTDPVNHAGDRADDAPKGAGGTGADEAVEVSLPGGMGSGGQVVRVGDTVRRPIRAHSASVRAFLDHVHSRGFRGAPRVLGTDEKHREITTWIDGDVGVPPYPDWVASHELLVSVAALQKELHHAAREFVIPDGAVWDSANLPPPPEHPLICHNDLCVENVVVRNGRAVAFIDFDFAAPADPLVDIAIALRHWVPVRDPVDVTDGFEGVEQLARFASFCDVHELAKEQRARVADELGDFLDRALISMKARADAGQPLYQQVWDGGYPLQNRRSRAWLEHHRAALVAA